MSGPEWAEPIKFLSAFNTADRRSYNRARSSCRVFVSLHTLRYINIKYLYDDGSRKVYISDATCSGLQRSWPSFCRISCSSWPRAVRSTRSSLRTTRYVCWHCSRTIRQYIIIVSRPFSSSVRLLGQIVF